MAIRDALDSEPALILATTLHTLGAIGVIAALTTHIAWVRKLRAGIDSRPLDQATFWLMVNAIVANLVGGFMRTYLPGHPSLVDFSGSPWVQVMALKHAFIFAALGALVYLHHRVAPRLRRLAEDGALPARADAGHAIGAWVIVTSVVVASVLGAMAQITPLGEGFEDDMHGGPGVVIIEGDGRTVRYINNTGSLTSAPPLIEDVATGTFSVPNDAVLLEATLIWSDPVASLRLDLDAARDQGNAGGSYGGGDGRVEARIDGPTRGDWTYRVSGENAFNVGWELSIRLASVTADETLLSEQVTIAPGTFFEINTIMPEGASFHWDWTTTEVVAFDVHSHFDGEVQYLVEKTTDADVGHFTNDREGGYSLLWDNEGNVPVTLTYRVWGEFAVDSYFPPR